MRTKTSHFLLSDEHPVPLISLITEYGISIQGKMYDPPGITNKESAWEKVDALHRAVAFTKMPFYHAVLIVD